MERALWGQESARASVLRQGFSEKQEAQYSWRDGEEQTTGTEERKEVRKEAANHAEP